MLNLIALGGWMMVPILLCSILATAIIGERFWALRASRIMPPDVVPRIWRLHRENRLDATELRQLQVGSPLGAIMAAALEQRAQGRNAMKENAEHTGRQVVHALEKYLNTLGTIASISPYMGLLGSVLGMIKVFAAFSATGDTFANPAHLAGGVSEILVATAAGLAIAIPSLIFYRYFQGRVSELVVHMEEETIRMIDTLDKATSAS